MLKNMRSKLILTSFVIILPVLIGLIFWKRLPDELVTHWDANGVPNGWSSKPFAVLGLPLFILAMHWICAIATAADPKAKNHSGKLMDLVLWICPAVSLFCGVAIYGEAFGIDMQVELIASIFVGLVFVVIGNYLPKCQHNYTVGIKLPWTLSSTENWNRTHRFAGPVWIMAGLAMILLAPFNMMFVLVAVLIAVSLLPALYSYWYYKIYECK